MSTRGNDGVPKVVVAVVNWNGGTHLTRCVQSALAQEGASVHVRVVDNGSVDDSLANLEDALGPGETRVEILRTGENLGFGRAVNRGMKTERAFDYGMALNTDVALEPDVVRKLVGFLEATPTAGLVGPRLLNRENGVEESAGPPPTLVGEVCRKFLLHLVFPFAKFRRSGPEGLARVGWVTGACILFRRDAFAQVGGMDEAIFMYYEDVDLCLRLTASRWGVYHFPEARAHHQGKASSRRVLGAMLVTSSASHKYVMEKHLGSRASRILTGLTGVEMALRSLIWQVQSGDGSEAVRREADDRLQAYDRIPAVVAGMAPGEPAILASEYGSIAAVGGSIAAVGGSIAHVGESFQDPSQDPSVGDRPA